MKILMFSKKLGEYDIDGVGEVVSDLGLDGVDLTVRPGGHIKPEDAVDKLPRAVEVLESYGLQVPMITTGIKEANEPYAPGIFKTASRCGIEFLKLGYWHYEGFGNIFRQLEDVRGKVVGIQRLAEEHGVIAGIHIHSGDFMTMTGEMVSRILEGIESNHVGAYIDPGHMVLEGTRSGWKAGMDLLRDRIKMIAVKDFGLERDPSTPKRWMPIHMPLSEGMVPWREVFTYLRDISFDGPISLHSEYENLTTPEIISQTSRDLCYIKEIIGELWGSG